MSIPHDTPHASPAHRLIGLELEFAGLTEETVARTVAETTGGTARPASQGKGWLCDTQHFGTCEVYLDSKLSGPAARLGGDTALDALRQVVPVELVTEPFDIDDLPRFDAVVTALRNAGALGSRDGLLFGFGLHLNIALRDDRARAVGRSLAAYALLEDHLRRADPIDMARRVLPFVDRYPRGLTDALARELPGSMAGLIDLYTYHAPSRDHGLDLLPIFASLAPDHLSARMPRQAAVKARPAFHFRLPDCRIDEPGWSVLEAWRTWRLVERVADDADLLDRLRAARRDWSGRPDWAQVVAGLLPGAQPEEMPA